MMKLGSLLAIAAIALAGAAHFFQTGTIKHVAATDPVAKDADDPAIWINPQDSAKSLIIGTDKGGGLYAFNLQGKEVQAITGLNHVNNVDVEYGLKVGNQMVDIAVATERGARRLLIFAIDRKTGRLTNITGQTATFEGKEGEQGAPMGIALYRRPKDGQIYAFVSPKQGGTKGRIWQYRLTVDAQNKVNTTKVREIGDSTDDEIEALAVDDELGFLYCSEEGVGIHKYYADPDKPTTRLSLFGTDHFMKDREGIAVYATGKGTGYIIVSDQGAGESEINVYRREGTKSNRNDHSELLAKIKTGADTTDGLEAVSVPVGPYKKGILVNMNSEGRNFFIYRWEDIQAILNKKR